LTYLDKCKQYIVTDVCFSFLFFLLRKLDQTFIVEKREVGLIWTLTRNSRPV